MRLIEDMAGASYTKLVARSPEGLTAEEIGRWSSRMERALREANIEAEASRNERIFQ